jgi:death-on-curing protein
MVLFDREMFPSPFDKCAALMWSLVNNHPFHAANKRTAFVAASSLMAVLNDGSIVATPENVVKTSLAVEAKEMDTEDLSRWFVNHTR